MARVKAWKEGAFDAPNFADDFKIVVKAVLQKTDLTANNNKYYAIELHQAGHDYRVFTHYGRTDDLETNPHAGMRESRFFTGDPEAARRCYDSIYRKKTAPSKGYLEVNLASSRIGSDKARGTSSGHVDAETLARMEGNPKQAGKKKAKPKIKPSTLPPGVQELIRYIYDEATSALTSTVSATITANGIETPLGVLTLGQIERGEQILAQLWQRFGQGDLEAAARLSGEFYSVIPHRIGRTRAAAAKAVIDTHAEFDAKQETLQLMKDMLKVDGEGTSVLFDSQVDQKYTALGCEIGWIDPGSSRFRELEDQVLRSQIKHKNIRVKRFYTLRRHAEDKSFDDRIGNEKLLFHGSRIKNWVGLLSRGILLPKIVVSMGVNRTDAGWLGHGIYFGDAACTSSFYTTPGRKKTRLMALTRVALGKVKPYRKITYGLDAPPSGYDSCHGIRRKTGFSSQFDDDEYVIYRGEQQRLEILCEFAA